MSAHVSQQLLKAAMLAFLVEVALLLGRGLSESQTDVSLATPASEIAAPEVQVVKNLPDFSSIRSIEERKSSFFAFLRPIVEAENRRVLAQRKRLLSTYSHHRRSGSLSAEDREWLDGLLKEYKLKGRRIESEETWKTLIARVDIVPVELALVQAAKETGWGTSRFARLGNNMFGQWCFSGKRGIVPQQRPEGAVHRVAVFGSVNESVRSYIRNINTHPAYVEFRRLRAGQRLASLTPSGHALAAGLANYSSQRHQYVAEIRDLLRINKPLLGG